MEKIEIEKDLFLKMAKKMKRYNKNSECFKCGFIQAKTKFTKVGLMSKAETQLSGFELEETEVMIRTCVICGYEWLEWPCDHKE